MLRAHWILFAMIGLILGGLVALLPDETRPTDHLGRKPRIDTLLKECYPPQLNHHLDSSREICRQFSQVVQRTAR